MTEQSNNENIRATKGYFDSWQSYQQEVNTDFHELYQHCGTTLDGEIHGRVLDIGSGGIFNYNTAHAQRLVALDYSIEAIDRQLLPENSILIQGDGTKLPFRTGSFDTVIMQFLIHHLALHTHEQTVQNVTKCLQESSRVLHPGGKLLVVESCLPDVLELVERLLYPLTRRSLKLVGQPMVFQFSTRAFERLVQQQMVNPITTVPISIGKFISQFGMRVPGWMSPCQIRLFKVLK